MRESPIRLRREFGGRIGPVAWPPGVRPAPFTPARAAEVHALLVDAYADGFGAVAPFEAWWPALAADSEYDPALIMLAEDDGGALVGVALCWTSAFVKDLAVRRGARRRGVGRALLAHVFATFKARGAAAVDLKVDTGNHPALRLYSTLLMVPANKKKGSDPFSAKNPGSLLIPKE